MGFVVENVSLSITTSLTLLKIFGLWLPQGLTGARKLLYYCYGFFVFIFALGIFIICQLVNLFQIWGDIPKMTAISCLLLTNLAHFSKIVNLIMKRTLIQAIIENAHEDLVMEIDDDRKQILNGCNFETKWQQRVYYFITSIAFTGWVTGPDQGQFPVPIWYPFDAYKSPTFEMVYCHQVIALSICGHLNIAKDTLVTSLIAQCRCRLRLLGLSLRNICSDIDIPDGHLLTLEQEEVVKSRLRVCVNRHQKALDAAVQLQTAFSEPTFAQFSTSLFVICVTAFQTVSNRSIVGLLSMLIYLVNMMYQVFIYCYQGNQLAEESSGMLHAVYDVPWYACRGHVRRSLLVMSIRTQRVALLTAGPFIALSLDSFMAIIKTSYSMFTLLQQVTERD